MKKKLKKEYLRNRCENISPEDKQRKRKIHEKIQKNNPIIEIDKLKSVGVGVVTNFIKDEVEMMLMLILMMMIVIMMSRIGSLNLDKNMCG